MTVCGDAGNSCARVSRCSALTLSLLCHTLGQAASLQPMPVARLLRHHLVVRRHGKRAAPVSTHHELCVSGCWAAPAACFRLTFAPSPLLLCACPHHIHHS